MHSIPKFRIAVEREWKKFTNRYNDDYVDFIYESKKQRQACVIYYDVFFLRPPKLQQSIHFGGRKNNLDTMRVEMFKDWQEKREFFVVAERHRQHQGEQKPLLPMYALDPGNVVYSFWGVRFPLIDQSVIYPSQHHNGEIWRPIPLLSKKLLLDSDNRPRRGYDSFDLRDFASCFGINQHNKKEVIASQLLHFYETRFSSYLLP
jgi:hypothetical protein